MKKILTLITICFCLSSLNACKENQCLVLARKVCKCMEDSELVDSCIKRVEDPYFDGSEELEKKDSYCESRLDECFSGENSCEKASSGQKECGFSALPGFDQKEFDKK